MGLPRGTPDLTWGPRGEGAMHHHVLLAIFQKVF